MVFKRLSETLKKQHKVFNVLWYRKLLPHLIGLATKASILIIQYLMALLHKTTELFCKQRLTFETCVRRPTMKWQNAIFCLVPLILLLDNVAAGCPARPMCLNITPYWHGVFHWSAEGFSTTYRARRICRDHLVPLTRVGALIDTPISSAILFSSRLLLGL